MAPPRGAGTRSSSSIQPARTPATRPAWPPCSATSGPIGSAIPGRPRNSARRWVTRVAPDPYLRVDTNDYSLDPRLVGQRVEVSVDQRHVTAIALDTGELAGRHARVFARHRTLTALEHARALREGRRLPAETAVEVRPLARYDALIA